MHEPCTPVADERKTLVQIVLASIVLCIFFPSGMLLHESGHYLAATCAGAEPDFSYRRVTYSRENLSELTDAVIQAAGPSIEVVFVLTGMLLIHITRARKQSELPGLRFWIGTALVLSSMRWLKAPFQGEGVTDESRISSLVGMPWWVVPTAMFIPTVIVLAYLLLTHYRHRTLVPLMVGFGFGIIGFILWYREIGPRLIPV